MVAVVGVVGVVGVVDVRVDRRGVEEGDVGDVEENVGKDDEYFEANGENAEEMVGRLVILEEFVNFQQ